MVSNKAAKTIALSFDETTEYPRSEKSSFKVKNKVFATINPPEKRMTVKLTPLDQNVFCTFDENVIYPVPNVWGKQGWTHANLKTIPKEMLQDLLTVAYCTVAPKKLAEKYNQDPEL